MSLPFNSLAKAAVLATAIAAIAWPDAGRSSEPELTGRDWRIVEVAGARVDSAGTVRFASNRISGRAACNSFFAMVERTPDGITIGPIGTTRMFCADRMALERETLVQLAKVRRVDRRGDRVSLIAADGKIALTLASK
jgi:heat shock protein HslJ